MTKDKLASQKRALFSQYTGGGSFLLAFTTSYQAVHSEDSCHSSNVGIADKVLLSTPCMCHSQLLSTDKQATSCLGQNPNFHKLVLLNCAVCITVLRALPIIIFLKITAFLTTSLKLERNDQVPNVINTLNSCCK